MAADYKALILDWAERHREQLGGLVTYEALVDLTADPLYRSALGEVYDELLQIGLGV